MQVREKRKIYFDYSLLLVILFLIIFGLVMIYSASSYVANKDYNNSMYFIKRQLIFAIVGFVAMLFVAFVDYHWYIKAGFVYPVYIISIISSSYVMFWGRASHGKRRWLHIFGVNFQPAELVKIAIILYLTYFISKYKEELDKEKSYLFKISMIILIPTILVLINNLSSAIIILVIAYIMLYISVRKKNIFIFPFISGVFVYSFLLIFSKNVVKILTHIAYGYRLKRILVWLAPSSYSKSGGFQVLQGLYTIASGGFRGKGLGQSLQKFKLPEAHNDMIFTIICEELGFVGALIIISLFIYIIFRLLEIAINARDLEGTLIVVGVMAQISIQVILNIAVVTNAIPNTGISLPFISYGGTSLIFLMMEIGMVFSVAKNLNLE